MDTQIDVEAVRARFRALPYAKAMRIATEANVSPATAQKFRMGRIKELGSFKLAGIANGMRAMSEGEQKVS